VPYSIALPLSSENCEEVFFCPEFKTFLVKIMVGISKNMQIDNKEIYKEIWKEEFNVNTE
jgi:hypothetical protein